MSEEYSVGYNEAIDELEQENRLLRARNDRLERESEMRRLALLDTLKESTVQEQTDWEAVAADQAMTISMMKVDQEKSESAYQRGYMDGMTKQRPWIGLTDEQIDKASWDFSEYEGFQHGAKWAQEQLKEKNS